MKKKILFVSSQLADYQNYVIIKKILQSKYLIQNLNFSDEVVKKRFKDKKDINFYLKKKKNFFISKKLIITGTSNNKIEKEIWKFCNLNKLKTLTIVDSWVNLKKRFNSKFLPNFIIFPYGKYDKNFIKKLKKFSKIYFLGNFFLNYISNLKITNRKNDMLYLTSKQKGYNDLNFIKEILSSFKQKKLYVKLHLKDKKRIWLKKLVYLSKINNNLFISKKSLIQNLKHTNLVFGIYSISLLASVIAGKRVFTKLPKSYENEYLYYLLDRYSLKFNENNIKNNLKKKKDLYKLKSIYKKPNKKFKKIINDICYSN
tara:strand:- start:143 stop:1084 length:942 start_codon:yes stop_codon:yes gene_type:complete